MTQLGVPRKLDARLIRLIHRLLPNDAPTEAIEEAAAALELSPVTVWHVVRGYSREDADPTAPWRLWEKRQKKER